MYKVEAKWTGEYPNLCSGKWIISVNGIKLSGLGDSHMSTLDTYQSWYFNEGWEECWEEYVDGLSFEDWISSVLPNNLEMSLRLGGFNPKDVELLKALYEAIQKQDWRHGSCGGCI